MKGIKMSDCRFYVDEDARTIVCVIPNTRDMVLNFIRDHFIWRDINFFSASDYKLDIKLEMPNSFMGKAVCADEDEWDEELGRKIAFSRAKDKCYKSFFKRANLFVQVIDMRLGDMLEMFNTFGEKLATKKQMLEDEINYKIKKEGDA